METSSALSPLLPLGSRYVELLRLSRTPALRALPLHLIRLAPESLELGLIHYCF